MTTRKPADRHVASGAGAVPLLPLPATPAPLPLPVAAVASGVPIATPVTGASRTIPAPARPIPAPSGPSAAVRVSEEEAPPADVTEVAAKRAPPWLVSLVVHLVLVVVLALIPIIHSLDEVIVIESEPMLAEKLGEQLIDDMLQSPAELNLEITPALALDNKIVDDPFAALPNLDLNLLDPNRGVDTVVAPTVGLALSGRQEGGKKALLAAYGGTETTEAAVREGLLWLKRNQHRDGSWSLLGPYADGAPYNDNKVAATAMALLAFQGAGHTHREGEFKDVVAKGWAALLKMQNADGFFECDTGYNQRLYAQGQAMIAVCEIYGMTQDKEFKEPALKAVKWAIHAQSPSGGWRYVPKEDSDTSVTGWYVMGLQSAMMAYLDVEPKALEKISTYLDSAGRNEQSEYAYQTYVSEPDITMTAEGLLCRQYLGWKHDDERLRRGVDLLLENKIDYKKTPTDSYYWYYATQVLHHMDGSDWDQWNAVMRVEVPRHQVKTGAERGSWSPVDDEWGTKGGRLYHTCLLIYMLEVYYRHLPIYKYRLR
ncbi:MAG TPA: prenyltransferase/squalene oxidase repeat-containing protein [Pirellulaceae bacterium]|nr:prenyltransferase/squalene oxidase repeat-containing protein [Pirellulaceae bacterium]